MQVRALSTAAAILVVGVVALASAACNPATKSKATPSVTVLPATETQADAASPTSSPSASAAGASTASSAPAVASASTAASSAASTAPAPAAGGGSTVDVCSLLTPAQASSINGVTYGAATPQHFEAGLDVCDYKNNGSPDPIDIQDLTTQVTSLSGCYTQLRQSNGPGVKVSGVGDDAFGYEIGIDVKVGNRCVEVSGLTSAEFKDNYAPDVAMAKIIIAGLH
ncbi:MAG TPA: hypothetical protein VIJ31_09675 [Acidothermaceae bacterium]